MTAPGFFHYCFWLHVVLPDVLTTSGGFILNSHLITTRFGRPSRFSMLVRCWLQLPLPFQGILAFLPRPIRLFTLSWSIWSLHLGFGSVSLCDELSSSLQVRFNGPHTPHLSLSLRVYCEVWVARYRTPAARCVGVDREYNVPDGYRRRRAPRRCRFGWPEQVRSNHGA
jgi:hypothetical protein